MDLVSNQAEVIKEIKQKVERTGVVGNFKRRTEAGARIATPKITKKENIKSDKKNWKRDRNHDCKQDRKRLGLDERRASPEPDEWG
jgi:hypothetical protein